MRWHAIGCVVALCIILAGWALVAILLWGSVRGLRG